MVYKADDPHSYSLDFTKVEIEWFEVDSHGNDIPVGTETIWSNSDPQVFTGPYNSGPNADGNMIQGYSFWYEGLDAAPPDPDALRFKLHFYADINGDDIYDSPDELYTQRILSLTRRFRAQAVPAGWIQLTVPVMWKGV